uniref:UbiA family prenyltransferase n=1 Tax=uncultured Tenacibaculum sp. TaxID=174713 RepID=UPI0026273595|nr:UbiA family prenyltransferase [uncultured Tenacibaculum sp.]
MNNGFLNIIQWKKIVYFVFILFLFKFCFLYGYGFKTTLSFFDLGLLSIASALLLASGYITSFIIRKQQKKTRLNLKKIKKLSFLLTLIGVLAGILLSFKIERPFDGILFIICPIIVHFYIKSNIKKTFISNIVTAFLKPFALLTLLWFDCPIDLTHDQWTLFYNLQLITIAYIIISFFSNIVIEIIFDLININEDNQNKQNTLPILLGRKRARNISLLLSIICCFFLFSISLAFYDSTFIFATLMLLGIIPYLYFIYYLMKASEVKDYQQLIKISYFNFFLALLSIPLIAYYLKYVIN